ncbi:MAG: HAD family hydrolase [Theionarchaea archaeon]|nr:HAD family hydrolase [Theionarchaea archaeon]
MKTPLSQGRKAFNYMVQVTLMLEIISFDVDGTLVDTAYADAVWLEGIPLLYAQEHHVDVDTAREQVVKAYDSIGDMDLRWYDLSYWFDRFKLQGSYEELLDTYRYAIHVYEDVIPVLQELHDVYTLIVISNAHRDFLNRTLHSMEEYFEHIFSATSDYGRVGKSENFYRRICRTLDISPQKMAHVGDHVEFDYCAPSRVGIQAFFLDRKKATDRQALHTLGEFREEIRNLEKCQE